MKIVKYKAGDIVEISLNNNKIIEGEVTTCKYPSGYFVFVPKGCGTHFLKDEIFEHYSACVLKQNNLMLVYPKDIVRKL